MAWRRKIRFLAVAALIALGVAAVCFFRDSPMPGKTVRQKKDYGFAPIRTHEVAIALYSMPDAVSYRVLSGESEEYGRKFSLFGLEKDDKSAVDILFVGSDRISGGKKISFGWKDALKSVAPYGEIVLAADVRDLTAGALKDFLSSIPWKNVEVWIVGEHNWVFVVREHGTMVPYSSILGLFLHDGAFEELRANGIDVPWSVFSSYAGSLDDVMPAFAGDLDSAVFPECFFSREVKKIPWIEKGDAEDDIYSAFSAKVREAGLARRKFLEGNALSRSPSAFSLDEAISRWQEAFRMNRRDVMINERLHQLAVNALAFSEIGNLKGAAKCYETMISVDPENPGTLRKYAAMMRKLGHREIALVAERKADGFSSGKTGPGEEADRRPNFGN